MRAHTCTHTYTYIHTYKHTFCIEDTQCKNKLLEELERVRDSRYRIHPPIRCSLRSRIHACVYIYMYDHTSGHWAGPWFWLFSSYFLFLQPLCELHADCGVCQGERERERMCVCGCVRLCVCIYIHVLFYIRTHAHKNTRICTLMHKYVHACMHACIHAAYYMQTHACKQTWDPSIRVHRGPLIQVGRISKRRVLRSGDTERLISERAIFRCSIHVCASSSE